MGPYLSIQFLNWGYSGEEGGGAFMRRTYKNHLQAANRSHCSYFAIFITIQFITFEFSLMIFLFYWRSLRSNRVYFGFLSFTAKSFINHGIKFGVFLLFLEYALIKVQKLAF